MTTLVRVELSRGEKDGAWAASSVWYSTVLLAAKALLLYLHCVGTVGRQYVAKLHKNFAGPPPDPFGRENFTGKRTGNILQC